MMPRTSQRIGLLGGSFNPAHAGHVHVSQQAMKRLRLDAVWWLVSPQNPLKSTHEMADYALRLRHARQIAARHRCITVFDTEQQQGLYYTVDTVRWLKRRYPLARFVWLMGGDNWAGFHRWRRWRQILAMVPVVIIDRAPFAHPAMRAKASISYSNQRISECSARCLLQGKRRGWSYLFVPRHPQSASAIRKALGENAFLSDN